jgi:predicted acetyltransferase
MADLCEVKVKVALRPAQDSSAIENMMQLYIHDFSELWSGTSRGELAEDGRFPRYPLEAYWSEADHIPLLLHVDGSLAGFALVNAASHSGLLVDRNMAEFFVVRKHRRGWVGTTAAHAIFSRYPGVWEAAVARRNVDALAFWRSAVARCDLVEDVEELDLETDAWSGPIIRFRVRNDPGRSRERQQMP